MSLIISDDTAVETNDFGSDSLPATPSVRSALTVAGPMSGREAAKVSQNARKLGVHENVVMAAPDAARDELSARRMESTPPVAGWASQSAVNASLAKEDLDGLEQLYNSIPRGSEADFLPREAFDPNTIKQWFDAHKAAGSDFKPQPVPREQRFWDSGLTGGAAGLTKSLAVGIPSQAGQLGHNIAGTIFGGLEWLDQLGVDAMRTLGITDAQKTSGIHKQMRDFHFGAANTIRKAADDLIDKPAELSGRLLDNPQYLLDPTYWGYATGEAASSLAVMVGAAALTGGVSATSVGFYGGLMEGTTFYNEKSKDMGNAQAFSLGMAHGVGTGTLNKIAAFSWLEGPAARGVVNRVVSLARSGGVEALTEYAEEPVGAAMEGIARGENPPAVMRRVLKSLENVDVIPGSFVVGLGMRAGRTYAERQIDAANATLAAQQQKDLNKIVSGLLMKADAPEKLDDALRYMGLDRNVSIPAQDVLVLHHSGSPILEAMGWEETDITEAAGAGQDITARLSTLHAHLEPGVFDKVADVMRFDGNLMSAVDAARVDEIINEEMDSLASTFEEYAAEQSALDIEKGRVREEAIHAISKVPVLRKAARQKAGSVEAYVDQWVDMVDRFARRMSVTGKSAAETFRIVALRAAGAITEEELTERLAQEDARRESVVYKARGRIDPQSLQRDYPGVYEEIVRRHGVGFFKSAENGGVPIDHVAAELAGNMLPHDAGANELVDALLGNRVLHQSEMALVADEALAKDSEAWRESVDSLQNGTLNKRQNITLLGQTPLVLQMLGAKNLPVRISPGKLTRAMEEHNLSFDLLKQIPYAVADPIMVFKSASVGGDLLLMLDLKDEAGATVNVPVALELQDTGGYSANIVTTVFGRRRKDQKTPDNGWFARQVDEGNLLYRNAKKSRNWARTSGLQLPGANSRTSSARQRIYTDADLVKLREANPTMYQFAGEKSAMSQGVRDLLATARELEAEGKDNEAIRQETGWFKGMDGKWRYEIPDEISKVDFSKIPYSTYDDSRAPLGKVYPNEPLYRAYPWLRDVIVEIPRYGLRDGTLGYWAADQNKIVIGFSSNQGLQEKHPGSRGTIEKTLLHEIQHAIQDAERFARGANLGMFTREQYQNVSGEIEARDTAKRSGLTAAQRAEQPPDLRYDAIILFGGGQVASMALEPATPRGSVTVLPDGYLVTLFKGANLSTLFHETGHVFMEEMQKAIDLGIADDQLVSDYQKLQDWTARFGDDTVLAAEYNKYLKGHPAFAGADFVALTPEQKEQARDIAQKEYFARGFEAYLMEGKAPTPELEGAFARFKKWIKSVYIQARNLDVELTDDVRAVFDRLLVTEAEVSSSVAGMNLHGLTPDDIAALGLSGADRAHLSGLVVAMRDGAEAKMTAARDAERKARLEEWRKEATEELDKDPVQQAGKAMRAEALDIDEVRELMGDDFARALMRKNPGGLKSGGKSPVVMAAELGFDDAAAMLTSVRDAPGKTEMVNAYAEQKQAEHDAGYNVEDFVLETDAAAEQLQAIGKAIADAAGETAAQEQTAKEREAETAERKREAGKATPQAAINLAAQARFDALTLQDNPNGIAGALNANSFKRAMSAALRDMRKAIGKNDWREALRLNDVARLNMRMAKLSLELRRDIKELNSQITCFAEMRKGNADARFIVNAVAARHGLSEVNDELAANRGLPTVQEWLQSVREDGYDVYLDAETLYGNTPYAAMTAEEFAGMADGIRAVIAVEGAVRQVELGGKKMEKETAVAEIVDSLEKNNAAKPQNLVAEDNSFFSKIKDQLAGLGKVEVLFKKLDGRADGPLWNIYKRMSDAADRRGLRMRDETAKLEALYRMNGSGWLKSLTQKIVIRSMGNTAITRENMLCVLLNMGNAVNTQCLHESGMQGDQIMEILSHVTEQDAAFANAVWKLLGSFKEESFGLEERVNGFRPKEVEASPFSLPTRDGKTVDLTGGYCPIAYDPKKSSKAGENQARGAYEDLFGSGKGAYASTRQGHMQVSAKAGLETPLKFTLSVIDGHIFDSVTDIAMREATIDVAKILRDKNVRRAIEGVAGVESYKTLMPWLQNTVRLDHDATDFSNVIRTFRTGVNTMATGFRVGTMLLQLSGLSAAVHRVGLGNMARGMSETWGRAIYGGTPVQAATRMMEAYSEIAAKSPFMATRLTNYMLEVRDASQQNIRALGLKGGLQKFRKHAFDGIGFMQMAVDMPLWVGAYSQGLVMYGGDEAKSIAHADREIRLTQGSERSVDLARIQTGGELQKLLTTFYSWFNTMYNLASLTKDEARRAGGQEGLRIAASFMFWAWFGTQGMEVALDFIRNQTPDKDDEDENAKEWAKYLAGKSVGFWAGMIPMGNAANSLITGRDLEFTPVGHGLELVFQDIPDFVRSAASGKKISGKQLTVGAIQATGYGTGLPLEPIAQTIKTVWDYADGTKPEIELRKLLLR